MRVWLLTIGEPLPTDADHQRLLRTGLLSRTLADRGHDVLWWTSAFDHTLKRLRCIGDSLQTLDARQSIMLLNGGGYKRNISIDRWRDHARLARRFEIHARQQAPPDVIVASLPSIELALAAVNYGRARGIPVVIDVRDLWPDVMVDLLPPLARPIGHLLTLKMRRQVIATCQGATAITGHASPFVTWGLRHAGRVAASADRHFPHGYPVPHVSAEQQAAAERALAAYGIDLSPDRIIVAFTGTIGTQTELAPAIEAAKLLQADRRIQFVIAGTGDRFDDYRRTALGLPNVAFPGWLNRNEIAVLLERATFGLAPYPHRKDWLATIPNKFPEYLSAGLPLLVSLTSGLMVEFIRENECGISYAHSSEKLASAISQLADDPENTLALKAAAWSAFERHFRAEIVYSSMVDYLEGIASNRGISRGIGETPSSHAM